MTNLSPIVLFVYNRPWHTRQTLEALSKNLLADESKLYIYADGPKENATEEQLRKINDVRKLIREKKWCREVEIIEREKNMGLANSVIAGVTEIVNRFGKIVVLEDDLVTSPGFLKYMNEALRIYENEVEVMHISGYMYPVKDRLPDTFFLITTSIWGWGTWKRAWKFFNDDAKKLLEDIYTSQRMEEFTFNNSISVDGMLHQKAIGLNESWDACWYANVFLFNGFCLHPYKSLVRNIGHDETGVHCKKSWLSNIYNKQEIADNIKVEPIEIIESKKAREAVRKFYISLGNPPLWVRAKEKMKIILK